MKGPTLTQIFHQWDQNKYKMAAIKSITLARRPENQKGCGRSYGGSLMISFRQNPTNAGGSKDLRLEARNIDHIYRINRQWLNDDQQNLVANIARGKQKAKAVQDNTSSMRYLNVFAGSMTSKKVISPLTAVLSGCFCLCVKTFSERINK